MSAINVIRRMNRSRAAALGLGVWLLSSAFPAFASNVLQQVSHAPGAKGGVEITLQFADPIADAQVFTTDNPPRIAIDLRARFPPPRRMVAPAWWSICSVPPLTNRASKAIAWCFRLPVRAPPLLRQWPSIPQRDRIP